MTAWSVMAQWCLPQIYSEPHEPVCWLDPRDETTKSWIHVLLQEVVHSDGVDYFTAQHDLLGAPMPLTGIKMIHDRARPGVLVCQICAASGSRRAIPTMAHMITHIQRHHSGRWVETKLARFFRKSKIRMTLRPFRIPDHAVGNGASNARRDIEAARRGSNEIWDNALNPFKLKSGSGDWVWCTDEGDNTREICPSDRIPLYHYRSMHDHSKITCQPAFRADSPMLVSDWVNIRRTCRALAGYWTSPNHADLRPFSHYYVSRAEEVRRAANFAAMVDAADGTSVR